MVTEIKTVKGSAFLQNFTYSYDDFRNLASRKEGKYATPMTETFKYDNLDRQTMYVGSCEFNHGLSREQRLTYISGPLGVFAVYEQLGELFLFVFLFVCL